MVNQNNMSMDHFDKAHDDIMGMPGIVIRQSTVISKGFHLIPQASWIIESVKTDETSMIFLQAIDAAGSTRLVIPEAAVKRILAQWESIMETRRSIRAQRGVATRKGKSGNIMDKEADL